MVQCIPRPNSFANLVDYFVQKALVAAFALIRDDNGLCPLPVCKLLLDLLKNNDNTGNEVNDRLTALYENGKLLTVVVLFIDRRQLLCVRNDKCLRGCVDAYLNSRP